MSLLKHSSSVLALSLCLVGAAMVVTPAFANSSGETNRTSDVTMSTAETQGILQHSGYLAANGYKRGEMDDATVTALRSFQLTHRLLATGAVNYETMTQLLSHSDGIDTGKDNMAEIFQGRKTITLKDVWFDTDTARLTNASHLTLDRVARSMNASPDVRVAISGYADSTNTDAYNLKLSQERAEAVCEYLSDQGVAGSRLVAQGYGETGAVGDNSTASGRAMNRRVEMTRIN